ncbi:MAG: 16S rRNA (cytosine(967)-C(5))-methyltransferase RsmB [Pseudomonadota bacterium]
MAAVNARLIALQVLAKVIDKGRSLDDTYHSDWFKNQPLSARDLAFSRELATGVCRWYYRLLPLLQQRMKKPLRARDQDIERVLLLGLYQILVMQTGDHAAVNETVQLTRQLKKQWASGLTNAVLRGVLRENIEWQDLPADTAYPAWMHQQIKTDWSQYSDLILDGGNQRPPMTLRVEQNRSGYLQQLTQAGIEASEHPVVTTAIVLAEPCDVHSLPEFDSGRVSVQDASAQLAAGLLPCKPGERVLDACAAPGGKTEHLLMRYPGIQLDALDISEKRLYRVQQNLERVGRTARLVVGDAAQPNEWFEGEMYDRALLDVPCTASGVIRRHPDIRLLRRENDIMSLAGQQQKIIDAVWSLLKPGGMMLYSTCSIFKRENEKQVAALLERHTDASEIDLSSSDWGIKTQHGRQLFPGDENMDGFYYALLTKSGSAG